MWKLEIFLLMFAHVYSFMEEQHDYEIKIY